MTGQRWLGTRTPETLNTANCICMVWFRFFCSRYQRNVQYSLLQIFLDKDWSLYIHVVLNYLHCKIVFTFFLRESYVPKGNIYKRGPLVLILV